MKKIYWAHRKHKKAGTAPLVSDQVHVQTREISRDEETHFIIRKGLIEQEIIILNVYALNKRASKYMKQKLIVLREKMDKSTITVGDLNIPLSVTEQVDPKKSVKL